MRHLNHRPRRRPGFTLVELLVVMVVIGMLLALLLPAIAGAIRQARAAAVTAEINNLATALAQFKTNYSDYPPSRIVLIESGNYPTVNAAGITSLSSFSSNVQTDITQGQLAQRSVRYMSKFFPRCNYFSTTGGAPAGGIDINGDGNTTGTFYLDGTECLVFFLGGMTTNPMSTGGPVGMSGFSRNPANPFDRTSSTRTQPSFEFKGDRLVDDDGDGFPAYNDWVSTGPQGRPYAYFSAYGGNAYDPNDCNIGQKDTLGISLQDTFSRAFQVNFTVNSTSYNSCYTNPLPTQVSVSPSPNPYTSTPAVPGTTTNWQNPQTFQIISAGSDQIFGVGGQWAGNNATNRLPIPTGEMSSANWAAGVCAGQTNVDDKRTPENDNLSNFVGGRLNQ